MNSSAPIRAARRLPRADLRRASSSLTIHDVLPVGALLATFAAVIGLFAISPITLEAHGIAYLTSGGGVLAKFHPSTLIAGAALALRCLSARTPLKTAWRLATGDPGVVLLLAAVAVAGLFAIFIDKTPVTPLVDTFVLPVMVFLLLRDLDPVVTRWLAIAVTAVLFANSIIAIAEFLNGWRLIHIDVPADTSADPTRSDLNFSWQAELSQDWRAVALLGHPLVNGLIGGVFLLCLMAPGAAWLPSGIRLCLIALQGVSMFAFGARTALVLTIVFGAWLVCVSIVEGVTRGARLAPRQVAAALLVAGCFVVGLALVSQSGFLDKTLQRFAEDSGSATTRLTMFSLLDPMSWSDLFLKPDKDLVATWQRMYGLEFGIESSWLGLVLTYGIIVTTIIIAGLMAFAHSLLRWSTRGGGFVLALYFILVSVSATMSGKSTTFAMTIALMMLFLRSVPSSSQARRVKLV